MTVWLVCKTLTDECGFLNEFVWDSFKGNSNCCKLFLILGGSLQNMLVKYVSSKKEMWGHYLDTCAFAYNASQHDSTKFTPFMLMFGRRATLPIDVELEHQDLDGRESEADLDGRESEADWMAGSQKLIWMAGSRKLIWMAGNWKMIWMAKI